MSLASPRGGRRSMRRGVLLALGLFGSALLYGDGMITPAITMLSGFEGVQVPLVRVHAGELATLEALVLL